MHFMRRATLAAVATATAVTLVACGSTADETTSETVEETMSEEVTTEEGAGGTVMDELPADDVIVEPVGTVVDIAFETGRYGTFVTAVDAAGLNETLTGAGPFTVFAPTDEAFADLPAGLLDALLQPENKDTLVKILTYHVVPGDVRSGDVTDGDVATVEGQTVSLSTADGVSVNGAKVIMADLVGSNGVIHGIDAVILPPDVDPNALLAE